MDINSYSPINIPPEIEAYLTVPQKRRSVDKSGKVGILRLKFARDPGTEKTVIKEQYSQVPFLIQRAMYLEQSLPEMAYVYIVSPSGGILQGDRYSIDINVSNNSYAHVTTQGATRIYKMEENCAMQMVSITLEEGSYFEYIPDQIIPFRNSRFYQEVHLKVHDNATMVYSEIIVPGRVASGEAFEYDIFYIRTVAKNHVGKVRFMDTIKLIPKKGDLTAEGILGTFRVVGTVYIITNECYVNDLKHDIIDKIKECKHNLSGGASTLPAGRGVIVRVLGKTAEDVKNLVVEVVRIARNQIIGASFSGIRKA